jgi:hypothetical protein
LKIQTAPKVPCPPNVQCCEEVARMTALIHSCAEFRFCADCGDERPFEQFHADCPDVPGECPEWGCTVCGAALIIGLPVPGYTAGNSVSKAA